MRKAFYLLFAMCILMITATSCLNSGLEDLENSSAKNLTAVNYTYRFLYDDTIKKGTPNQEIQIDRVCEIVFNKQSQAITENGISGFRTTLTHNLNSVQKAGPTGSVTKEMLYEKFKKLIATDGLTKLWVYVTISDASTIMPLNNAPKLGAPGDFSKDHNYRVKAADGSTKDYILQTVKGF